MNDEPFGPVARIEILAEACQNPRRTRSEIATLVILAKRTNGLTGESWPSYQSLATAIGASRQAVITAIKKLAFDGVIRVKSRGPQKSQMFVLVKPTLPVKPALLVKPTILGSQADFTGVVKPTLPEPVIEPVIKPVLWMDGGETPSHAPGGAAQANANLQGGNDRYPEFWKAYPVKSTVAEAEQKISELEAAGVDLQEIIDGAQRYKNYSEATSGRRRQSAKQWLSRQAWRDDWTLPAKKKPESSKLKALEAEFNAANRIKDTDEQNRILNKILMKIEADIYEPHIWPNGKPKELIDQERTACCRDCFDLIEGVSESYTGCIQMAKVDKFWNEVSRKEQESDPNNQPLEETI